MLIQTRNTSHCKFGAYQKWEPAGCRVDFGIFFTFSLKAHYYPSYHIGVDFCVMEFSAWKHFIM